MSSTFNWYGDKFLKKFNDEQAKDLTKAAIFLTNKIKESINAAKSPPVSSPDNPPHRWKGLLLHSITWEVDKQKLVARCGSNSVYSKYLELGTKRMAKRPFLRTTLAKYQDQVAKIIAGKKHL